MTKYGRASIFALIAGIVLCTAVRTAGILFYTDMKTGFLFHDSELLYCGVFYGILAVAAVVTAVLGQKAPQSDDVRLFGGGATAIGLLAVAMAVLAAWDGIANFGGIQPSLLLIIGDFCAAAYLMILGIATLVKRNITAGTGFMYSVVGIYFIVRAVAGLSDNMIVLGVQEHLLDVLSVTAGGVFFALFGKVYSANAQKHSLFFLRLWGALASMLALSSSLGVIIAKLFGSEEISGRITADLAEVRSFYQNNVMNDGGSYMMSFVPYVNTLMGIFALAAVIRLTVDDS